MIARLYGESLGVEALMNEGSELEELIHDLGCEGGDIERQDDADTLREAAPVLAGEFEGDCLDQTWSESALPFADDDDRFREILPIAHEQVKGDI